jgi:hypothetical protein
MFVEDHRQSWLRVVLYRVRAVTSIPFTCIEGLVDRKSRLGKLESIPVGNGILHHYRIDGIGDAISVIVRHFARHETIRHSEREYVHQLGYGQAEGVREAVDPLSAMKLITFTKGGKHGLEIRDFSIAHFTVDWGGLKADAHSSRGSISLRVPRCLPDGLTTQGLTG